jgi:hypothetical protein
MVRRIRTKGVDGHLSDWLLEVDETSEARQSAEVTLLASGPGAGAGFGADAASGWSRSVTCAGAYSCTSKRVDGRLQKDLEITMRRTVFPALSSAFPLLGDPACVVSLHLCCEQAHDDGVLKPPGKGGGGGEEAKEEEERTFVVGTADPAVITISINLTRQQHQSGGGFEVIGGEGESPLFIPHVPSLCEGQCHAWDSSFTHRAVGISAGRRVTLVCLVCPAKLAKSAQMTGPAD